MQQTIDITPTPEGFRQIKTALEQSYLNLTNDINKIETQWDNMQLYVESKDFRWGEFFDEAISMLLVDKKDALKEIEDCLENTNRYLDSLN